MAQRNQTGKKAVVRKASAPRKRGGDNATKASRTNGSNAVRRSKPPAAEMVLNRTGLARLGKGELAAQVLDHLRAHPKVEFTPTELSHKLNRSNGAIQNACERAMEDGLVVRTSDAPKRYRYAGPKGPRRARTAAGKA